MTGPSRPGSPQAGAPPHCPRRPLWLCRNCAAPWPCGEAKLALLREYGTDLIGLRIYLAIRMHDAIGDLLRLHPDTAPEPAELWRRFLAWTTRRPRRFRLRSIGR